MKNKKIRPFARKLSKQSVHSTKPRQKWWLGILLIVLLIGYFVWQGMAPHSHQSTTENLPLPPKQNEPTQIASVALDDNANNIVNDENQDRADLTDSDIPDPKAILEAPLPETDSLAKEEIDRLEDERKRLAEQEKLAAEQIAMTKQLTELKAQEIALLEQQIAQLEADTAAKDKAN